MYPVIQFKINNFYLTLNTCTFLMNITSTSTSNNTL